MSRELTMYTSQNNKCANELISSSLLDPVNSSKTSTPTPWVGIPAVACKKNVAAGDGIVSHCDGQTKELCRSTKAGSTAAVDSGGRNALSSCLNFRRLPKSYTNPFVPTTDGSCLPFPCALQVHNRTHIQTNIYDGVIGGTPRGGSNNHTKLQQEGQQLLCTPRETRKGINNSSSKCDFSTFCNEDSGMDGCSSLSLTRDYSGPLFSSPSIVPGPTPQPAQKKTTTHDDDHQMPTPFTTPESSHLTWISTKTKGEDAAANALLPSSVASSPHASSLTHSSSLEMQDVEFRVENGRHHDDDCYNEKLPSTSSQPREVEDMQQEDEYVVRLGNYDEGGMFSSSHCVSRFVEDFEVIDTIGRGSFGSVFKVLHRLDGCPYAVKRSRQHASREMKMQCMLNEVFALAALCSEEPSKHLLMYNSAWIEDDMLYIQTELCDITLEKWLFLRGDDEDIYHQPENTMKAAAAAACKIVAPSSTEAASINEKQFPPLLHCEARKLMRHIALALEIVHRRGMVHLDIAPKNIFLKGDNFKLGDFGLVTRLNAIGDVMEGDARYMSSELLQMVSKNVRLDKCDVFSLGITLFEVLSGRGLPHNGESWHHLRSGEALTPAPGCPVDLLDILHSCMHPDPACRETASGLLQLPTLRSGIEQELHRQQQINTDLRNELSALKNRTA